MHDIDPMCFPLIYYLERAVSAAKGVGGGKVFNLHIAGSHKHKLLGKLFQQLQEDGTDAGEERCKLHCPT